MNKPLAEGLRTSLVRSLFLSDDRVLVAVSGGPDSLALLHALHGLQSELGLADLQAAHLDHGLRGDESAAEALFVAAFCRERGIPCTLGRADVAALRDERRVGTQEAARAARLGFLETTAVTVGADKVATGTRRTTKRRPSC